MIIQLSRQNFVVTIFFQQMNSSIIFCHNNRIIRCVQPQKFHALFFFSNSGNYKYDTMTQFTTSVPESVSVQTLDQSYGDTIFLLNIPFNKKQHSSLLFQYLYTSKQDRLCIFYSVQLVFICLTMLLILGGNFLGLSDVGLNNFLLAQEKF